MINEYQEINLGDSAINYFRKRLEYGLTLSKYILETIDLEAGQVTTAFPKQANLENIYKFQYGGILPTSPESEWREIFDNDGRKHIMKPLPMFYAYIEKNIRSFLSNSPRNICLFENAYAGASDGASRKYQSQIAIFQNEIYHLVVPGKDSNNNIEQVINESGTSLNLIGILTTLDVKYSMISTGQRLTSHMLKDIAGQTEKLILRAYDGESFLVWHKIG
jgi:hypothetical protein